MNHASPGDTTLRTYEVAAGRYRAQVAGATPAPKLAWLELVVSSVAPGAHCLELGSGPGRDALMLEERGLRVTRTAGATAFVEMMRKDGYEARRLDVRHDEFGGPYDLVFADAMLLHLTPPEFDLVLRKARAAVHPGGVLALTLKEGDGDEWHRRKLDLPRHFTYWRAPALRTHLSTGGWQVESLEHAAGTLDDWLYVVATAEQG